MGTTWYRSATRWLEKAGADAHVHYESLSPLTHFREVLASEGGFPFRPGVIRYGLDIWYSTGVVATVG